MSAQVCSIFDRWQRLEADKKAIAEIDALFTALKPTVPRLHYAFGRLLPFTDDRGYIACRAFIAAGRLINCGQRKARREARSIVRARGFDGYFERIACSRVLTLPDVGPLDRDQFGYVYLARLRDFPFVLKVGFSADPVERMKSLRYQTGCVHELEQFAPGTLLDEAIEFIRRRADHINNEWFLDPTMKMAELPAFLGYGASRGAWEHAIGQNRAAVAAGSQRVTMDGLSRVYLNDIRGIEQGAA